MADNFDESPEDADCAFIMRNVGPEYIEALNDLLVALLEETSGSLEVKVSLNDCEGYQVHQRVFEYVHSMITSSTG